MGVPVSPVPQVPHVSNHGDICGPSLECPHIPNPVSPISPTHRCDVPVPQLYHVSPPPPRCPQVVNEGPSAISHGTLELSCPLALGDRPLLYIVGHSGPRNCSASHSLDRMQLAVRMWGREWGHRVTMGGGQWGHWETVGSSERWALGGTGWLWMALGTLGGNET